MTRINCINPSHLNDKALSGEWHEIPRVITLAKDAYWKGTDVFNKTMKRVPSAYTMGTGHVLFFYPRLGYIVNHYHQLAEECKNRGWKVNPIPEDQLLKYVPKMLLNDWQPDENAIQTNMQRLIERNSLL